ncbi:uncharacterized protein LOC126855309 isoform X2 [Cataglyphis hispanica]|uniref:uncharacterized protein LOC126855309 isoform X2 n=1 Tax=Cataglyphis hispanica TaxID=1086592 RepID=UPI00217F74EB|nr:uncharacterized protein LOC126855309 isoform X2 [Cataglyphis hispanica]
MQSVNDPSRNAIRIKVNDELVTRHKSFSIEILRPCANNNYGIVRSVDWSILVLEIPRNANFRPIPSSDSRMNRWSSSHTYTAFPVSWMRSRDLHILTSGNFSFSSDARFGAQHTPGSDAWTLRLDNARKTDSGKYECQVNTEPKIMYAVQLSVRDPDKSEGHDEPYSQQTRISYESTAPVADIIGPQEQRVPSGSTITLRCVILSPYQTRPIRGVQWLRDNKLLTFQAARGGINVETVRDAARTVSVLTLAAVTQDDVGNYSCRPTEGRSDTVTLVVEEGERTEAMQRDAGYVSSGSNVRHWPGLLLPFPWLLILASNSQTFLL